MSKIKVTALDNVSASKIVTFHGRIDWINLHFVKIIP